PPLGQFGEDGGDDLVDGAAVGFDGEVGGVAVEGFALLEEVLNLRQTALCGEIGASLGGGGVGGDSFGEAFGRCLQPDDRSGRLHPAAVGFAEDGSAAGGDDGGFPREEVGE